jgi:hypothetical protein
MTATDWGLLLMLTSASINIAMSIDLFRKRGRMAAELDAAKARMEALVQSMLPAVGVCWMLTEDPDVPEPWRDQARKAIPEGITVTKTPTMTRWGRDTLH